MMGKKYNALAYQHSSKFKDTSLYRQKNNPNSEYILVVRRGQIFQSSGPGTYPRASRKAPPATFADESSGSPKYTSDWRRLLWSNWYIISTPAQFSSTLDGTGADGPRSEGGRRILLDNSRVYVRFSPFVSGRVRPIRLREREPDYGSRWSGAIRHLRDPTFIRYELKTWPLATANLGPRRARRGRRPRAAPPAARSCPPSLVQALVRVPSTSVRRCGHFHPPLQSSQTRFILAPIRASLLKYPAHGE